MAGKLDFIDVNENPSQMMRKGFLNVSSVMIHARWLFGVTGETVYPTVNKISA
jgi:hypothetical protein